MTRAPERLGEARLVNLIHFYILHDTRYIMKYWPSHLDYLLLIKYKYFLNMFSEFAAIKGFFNTYGPIFEIKDFFMKSGSVGSPSKWQLSDYEYVVK